MGITEHSWDRRLAPLSRYGERRGEHDPGRAPGDQVLVPRTHVDLGFPRGGDQVCGERLVEGSGQVGPERGDLPGDDHGLRAEQVDRSGQDPAEQIACLA
jgi:hypothetical protein